MSSGSSFSRDVDGSDNSEFALPFDLHIKNDETDSEYLQEFPPSHKLGSLFMSAPPEDPLDWALVTIDDIQSLVGAYPDLPINSVFPKGGEWIPLRSLRAGREGRVLICLGRPGSLTEGIMSGVSSFSKVRGSKSFQELWQVKRHEGSFGEFKNYVI